MPPSFSVGTSGIWAARLSPVVASGRSRPALTNDEIAGMFANVISTSPPTTAVSDGAVPLKGTCTIFDARAQVEKLAREMLRAAAAR